MFTKTFDCVRSLSFKPVWASFQRAFKNNDTEEQPKFMRNIIDFEGNGFSHNEEFLFVGSFGTDIGQKGKQPYFNKMIGPPQHFR